MQAASFKEKILVFLILLAVSLILLRADKLVAGYAPPANDARAHIFRIIYFLQGMLNGNYVSSQYHGYAFLAGYGVFFYMVSYIGYALLTFLLGIPQAISSVFVFDVAWVLAPVALVFAAMEVLVEYRKLTFGEYLAFAIFIFFLPFNFSIIVSSEAIPYSLCFIFSLLALKYIIRFKKADTSKEILIFIWLFSVLSIYTETFGYFFTLFNFLLLIPDYKALGKLSLAVFISTPFSWLQLLEVSGYMSPLLNLTNFDLFLYICAVVILLIYLIYLLVKKRSIANEDIPFKLAVSNLFLGVASLLGGLYASSLGSLGGILASLMPERIIGLNLIVLASLSLMIRLKKFEQTAVRVILMSLFVFSLSTVLFILPSPSAYKPIVQGPASFLSNHKIIIPPPAIYSINLSAFSTIFNYSDSNGPYNQGDPSFFYITAYYEWTNAFITHFPSFVNIMQLTGSNAILAVSNTTTYANHTNFLGYDYEYPVYSLNTTIADSVTPIIILSPNNKQALLFSLFVNFLANNGFSYEFTTQPTANVSGLIILPGYNSTAFASSTLPKIVLRNANINRLVKINSSYYVLYTDAMNESATLFPYASPSPYPYFASSSETITNSSFANATFIANAIQNVFHPVYLPIKANSSSDSYSIGHSSMPVVLKVSYYPYFYTTPQTAYTYDIYHFILLPSGNVTLKWSLPFFNASMVVSAFGICISIFYFKKEKEFVKFLKRIKKKLVISKRA